MRIMGLDVGSKTIGVAVSDPLGYTAQGVTTVRRTSMTADLEALRRLADEYQVESVLIGLPLNMNGSAGPAVDRAREVGTALEEALGLPILYRDERLSTVAAQRILLEGDLSRRKRKQVVDKMAAVFVLQGYLDQIGAEKQRPC